MSSNRKERHVLSSMVLGSLFPGGRHRTALVKANLVMFANAKAWRSNFPESPMNCNPISSSSLPGPSPISSISEDKSPLIFINGCLHVLFNVHVILHWFVIVAFFIIDLDTHPPFLYTRKMTYPKI